MGTKKLQPWSRDAWALARQQHGVVSRAQLLGLGLSPEAIRHRLRTGRLHRIMRGVYAVGRPADSREALWMAAVLACGPAALLSHRSAAELWGMGATWMGPIDVAVPSHVVRRHRGLRIHRKTAFGDEVRREVRNVPVTDPATTLIDLAACATLAQLEAAANEADQLDLIDPEALRAALDRCPPRPGVGILRTLLDAQTFVLTESELERRFLRLVRAAGLPRPESQVWLDGRRVDFYWPELNLVVECDGLRYHRTASRQSSDLRREQAHAMAGRPALRFSHREVRHEAGRVEETLRRVMERLSPSARAGGARRGGGGGSAARRSRSGRRSRPRRG